MQGKAGHVGWPQASGKDVADPLKDSQGQWGTVGVLGPWGFGLHWGTGLVGDWSAEGCWVREGTGVFGMLGQLVTAGMQDVALMGTWSPYWDAELMGIWSLP